MSKIGKKPIVLPPDVTVTLTGSFLTVKGPKGTLTREFPNGLVFTATDGVVLIKPATDVATSGQDRAIWGLWHALVANMIYGVSKGWETELIFQGVGYKAIVKGNDLELALGYSHPITVTAPEGISFFADKATIKVSGINKELVGHIAAIIRSKRLPEPYKGSGIRYADEIIKKKAGKKAATAA